LDPISLKEKCLEAPRMVDVQAVDREKVREIPRALKRKMRKDELSRLRKSVGK
jgi:hypothetical protein